MQESNKVALLIDADLIAYRCSSAAEKRSIKVKHKKSGDTKEFSTRTEFKKFLKDKNLEYNPDKFEIEDIQTAGEIKIMYNVIDKIMSNLQEFTFADVTEVYLGEGRNFRHELDLPSPYKDNRAGNIKPLYLKQARKYLRDKYKAKDCIGEETDDVVTYRAYHWKSKGYSSIIATLDKDAMQSSGCYILDWTKERDKWELLKIPEVGELWKEKSTVKGTGLKFLALQTIAGDLSDTYCGYELLPPKSYGPTKAMKVLEGCSTSKEVLEALVSEFKRMYPSPVTYTAWNGKVITKDHLELLQMYWHCAYMKRTEDDPSDFISFAKQHGVNL